MKYPIPVSFKRETKKISLFDILISDIHAGDDYTTIEGTAGLTYHEVWEWISEGGDWAFKITEHNNPENIFMTGTSYHSMNDARNGESELHLGYIHSKTDIDEISDFLRESVFNPCNKNYVDQSI